METDFIRVGKVNRNRIGGSDTPLADLGEFEICLGIPKLPEKYVGFDIEGDYLILGKKYVGGNVKEGKGEGGNEGRAGGKKRRGEFIGGEEREGKGEEERGGGGEIKGGLRRKGEQEEGERRGVEEGKRGEEKREERGGEEEESGMREERIFKELRG